MSFTDKHITNALARMGHTLESASQLTDKELLSFPTIGKTSLAKIRAQHPYELTTLTNDQLLDRIALIVDELKADNHDLVLRLFRKLLYGEATYWDTEATVHDQDSSNTRRRLCVDGTIYNVTAEEIAALDRWLDEQPNPHA